MEGIKVRGGDKLIGKCSAQALEMSIHMVAYLKVTEDHFSKNDGNKNRSTEIRRHAAKPLWNGRL